LFVFHHWINKESYDVFHRFVNIVLILSPSQISLLRQKTKLKARVRSGQNRHKNNQLATYDLNPWNSLYFNQCCFFTSIAFLWTRFKIKWKNVATQGDALYNVLFKTSVIIGIPTGIVTYCVRKPLTFSILVIQLAN
jgi:hypothetical protein